MPTLYPKVETLQQAFGSPHPFARQRNTTPKPVGATPYQAQPELYYAYSVVDDTKDKAKKLSADAQREFDAASKKAQATTGKIELYSGKYYAACTFGGLLACVSDRTPPHLRFLRGGTNTQACRA